VQPTVAEPWPAGCQRPQRLPDGIVAAGALVAHARPRCPQRVARSALADAEPVPEKAHDLTASHGRHHFRWTAAFSIWLSSVRSATSVFSRRFSSSSARSFRASLTSRPPYLLRQR